MLRLTILGLVAFFLSLVSALPTATLGKVNGKLLGNGNTHASPDHHDSYKPWQQRPTATPTPSATPCPTGKPYYIQASANNNYASVTLDPTIGADTFEIDFRQPDTTTATIFTFAKSRDGVCRLSLFPTAALPSTAGFYSVVYDTNAGEFNPDHFVFISGPAGSLTLTPRELQCQMSNNSLLMCSVNDPTGGGPQMVLELDNLSNAELVINTVADLTPSNFTLIPAPQV